jgi:hypothetical protein
MKEKKGFFSSSFSFNDNQLFYATISILETAKVHAALGHRQPCPARPAGRGNVNFLQHIKKRFLFL